MSKSNRSLFSLLENHKMRYILAILICAMIDPLYRIGYAFVSQWMFNAIEFQNVGLFVRGLLSMGGIVLIYVVAQPITAYYYETEVYKPVITIERSILSNVMQLPMSFYGKTHTSGIFSRITNDLEVLSAFFKEYTYDIAFQVIYGIGAFISLLVLDARFLIPLLALGVLSLFSGRLFGKRFFMLSQKVQQAVSRSNEQMSDLLSGLRIIKVFKAEKYFIKRYRSQMSTISSIKKDQNQYTVRKNAVDSVIKLLGFFVVFVMAVYFYLQNTITLGTIVAILSLQSGVVNYFVEMSECIKNYNEAMAGAMRIFDLIDLERENDIPMVFDAKQAALQAEYAAQFDHVSFSYEQANVPAVNDISMAFRKNTVTAVVGESGSGKSTLLSLLLKFYVPEHGSVKVLDTDIAGLGVSQLRDLIAYVQQTPVMLNETIGENIRFGKQTASEEEMVAAAKKAGIHDFIWGLPEQYDTMIGPDGAELSGGEAQRVVIARAFLKDAPILILDEPTSALDYKSEKIIESSLRSLCAGRAVIVVAHRLYTIKNADYVYVMDGGRVIEEGTYEGLLLRKNKLYSLHMKGAI